jgi:hypothetical protein
MNCNFVSCLKTIRRIVFNSLFLWATTNRFTIYHLLENVHNFGKELTVFLKNIPTKLNIKLLWETLLLSPYIEYTDIDTDKNTQYLSSIEDVIQDAIEHIIEDLNVIPEIIENFNEEFDFIQLSSEQPEIIELENISNERPDISENENNSNERPDISEHENDSNERPVITEHDNDSNKRQGNTSNKGTSFFPLSNDTNMRDNNNKCCLSFRKFITLFR